MKALRYLIASAALMNGLLAGLNVQRALVEMPAWRAVGAPGWSTFSRNADLGPNARIVVPFEAFAGTILSISAALLFAPGPQLPRIGRTPVYAAAVLSALGLLTTLKAAPFMLSLRQAGNDPILLQRAFRGFEFWGGVRGVFHVLAFCASLWSLVACSNPQRTAESGAIVKTSLHDV